MNYCFGVDIGGTTVKIGLFEETGTIVEKWEIPTNTLAPDSFQSTSSPWNAFPRHSSGIKMSSDQTCLGRVGTSDGQFRNGTFHPARISDGCI